MAKATHRYALTLVALIPLDTVEEGREITIGEDFPPGTIVTADVVEEMDLSTDAEWSQWGEACMFALASQVANNGWPVKSAEAGPAPDAPTTEEPEPAPPAANVGFEGNQGLCWRCQSILVETARGVFCPQGCPDSPPVEGADDIETGDEIEVIGRGPGPAFIGVDVGTDPSMTVEGVKNADGSVTITKETIEKAAQETKDPGGTLSRLAKMEEAIMGIAAAVKALSDAPAVEGAVSIDVKVPREKVVDKPVKKMGTEKGKPAKSRKRPPSPRAVHRKSTGKGTMAEPYQATPEDPKPSSFPQGPTLPTTD